MKTLQNRRRNSVSIAEIETIGKLDNQINDYSKRRYTADTDTEKSRKREFLERQIGLGNLEVHERSNEDISLSLQSAKVTSDDISKDDEISETIFHMDSLEMDSKEDSMIREETLIQETIIQAIKVPEFSNSGEIAKSGKKKKRKKSLMKKKNSQRKTSTLNEPQNDVVDAVHENANDVKESVTDRSSLDSNNSESSKDTQ